MIWALEAFIRIFLVIVVLNVFAKYDTSQAFLMLLVLLGLVWSVLLPAFMDYRLVLSELNNKRIRKLNQKVKDLEESVYA